jgi:hypothetical protein
MPRKRAKKVNKKETKASIPLGVQIIAILAYIGSGVMALMTLLLLIGTSWLLNTDNSAELLRQMSSSFGAISSEITPSSIAVYAVLIVIICALLAVINFFVGRGLWCGQKWARILVIIYAVVQVVSGLLSIVTSPAKGIFAILLYGIIGAYLAFSVDAKKFFR